MDNYRRLTNTGNSYAERKIYDDIIANLDSFVLSTCETEEYEQKIKVENLEMWGNIEDLRLTSVMNDHNYILRSRSPNISYCVRENLIDFVKKNSSSSSSLRSSEESIGKMIDSVMRLLSNATDYDTVTDQLEHACDPQSKAIPNIEAADQQNLNKCRNQSEEACAQEKIETNVKVEINFSPVKEPENVVSIKDEIECDTKPPLVLISESAVSLGNSAQAVEPSHESVNDKVSEKSSANPEECINDDKNKTEDKDPTNHNEIANTSQADDSLKDLPVSTCENVATKDPPEKPSVITELLKFAEKLKEDCASITSKDDIDLNNFLATHLTEYKTIINSQSNNRYTDSSVQTVKVISKKKLRKINAKDKRLLLQSSNDSDSSNSSYIGKSITGIETEFSSKKPVDVEKKSSVKKEAPDRVKSPTSFADSDFGDECMKSDSSDSDESDTSSSKSDSDDSDDSDSSNLSEKEKDKSTCLNSNSKDNHDKDKDAEKGTNESDKENRSVVESPEGLVAENSKEDGKIDEDNQDKQIERLLNLKGLTEPQKNTSLPNNSKPPKLASKSKTDRLFAVMQEADKNSSSEDSGHEEGEPVLTEKQFLFKCNENLKQQLLNSASSDSENFNSDEDAHIIHKNNEHSGDEDEKHLSNVDKFLETLVDTEENSPATTEPPKPSSPTKSVDTSTDKNSSVIELDDTDPPENAKADQEAMSLKKKEVPKKSFETLLSNEKRQKPKPPEEPIDLSGESSNSDVEEFPVESKDKSQRIKPMLRQDQLESETIYSQKKEAERLRRLEKKNTYLTKMLKYSKDSINETDLVLDYATANKKFIKVHPDIVKHLKPHQRDGVKFMYDSCYGCVDHLKENSGSGCILAHCMGLGKTLQIIALLHTVTSYKELKTAKILVLCPKSTIMNWADEIQRWLGPLDRKIIQIFNFSDTADVFEKINVLRQWSSLTGKAGCMIMGYEAFRSLVFYNSNKNRMKSAKRIEDIRASINKYLLKPGADLVVCDEGHIIKNRKSGISLAAAKIVTPKRIVLTGTPIQNNLKEYYSMVNFIKPLILGTEKEFANLYANPIKNGQHKDSSKRDIKVMKQRSFVLHKKLSKFVQRKEAELLQSFLPQKFEYVLFIPMSTVQNNLYEYVLDAISKREDSRGRSLITDYTCLRKIWTHPKVLEDAWKNAITARNKKEPKKTTALGHSDDDQPDDIYDNQTGVISVQRDWWRSMLTETDLESMLPSNKLKTMFEIIRMSEENGEKCLIFSAFVAVLNVVECFLNKINDSKRNYYMFDGTDKSPSHWVNGQDYYRLDGKTNKTLRHEMIKRFNDPKNKRARLFLISARAGGQGINLIGANRVIILDTSWNPANDQQNIFRIFRLGQKKNCYVYRLIAMGTMEEKVYSRSVTKQAMSFRVVDEQQIDRHYSMAELAELYTLTKPDYSERPLPVFPQDQILANLLLNFPDLVYKYHEHDSLLENKVEQELSEQEKADAWVAYERDLQMNSEPQVTEGYHGPPLFGQGNYMYPMANFDPNTLLPTFDLTQMDMARNPLGAFPNYLVNRTSYLDLINMYKKFSSTLVNDKNNRNARYNPNYAMSLASGMMGNAMGNAMGSAMSNAMCNVMPPTDSHLSALTNPLNPYYQLAKNPFANPLNSNPMLSNPNLAALSQVNSERYERNKNMISVDDPIPPSLCNYNLPLPPYPQDLSDRSMQQKNLMQNVPPPSSASPSQQAQNMFNPNLSKDIPGIPRTVIQKKRGRPSATSSPLRHSNSPLDPAAKSRAAADSLLRTPSPAHSMTDPISKLFDPSGVPGSMNMGIVYPQPAHSMSSPSRGENSEGGCLLNSGSSMQIIPTHTQLAESVRKKFDNISPNISLTAVRSIPKPEQLQPPLNSSHMEVIPSNVRKRRISLSSGLIPESERDKMFTAKASPLSAIDQPSYPPKVTKF